MTDWQTTGPGNKTWNRLNFTSQSVRQFRDTHEGARPDAEFRKAGNKIEIRTGARVLRARGSWNNIGVPLRRAFGLISATFQFGKPGTGLASRRLRHAEHGFDKGVNRLVEDLANGKVTKAKQLEAGIKALHPHAMALRRLAGKDADNKYFARRFKTNLKESLDVLAVADPKRAKAVEQRLHQMMPALQRYLKPASGDAAIIRQNLIAAGMLVSDPEQEAFIDELAGTLKDVSDERAGVEKAPEILQGGSEFDKVNFLRAGPEPKAELGWIGDPRPGAPSLKGLKTDYGDKFAEGESHISTYETADGKHKLVGKIERREAVGHLKRELEAYNHIYDTVGPHRNLATVHGMAAIKFATRKEEAMMMDEVQGQRGSRTLSLLHKAWKGDGPVKISSTEYWGAVQFLGRRMLDVTGHLTKAGILHNDIKPENYVVDRHTGEPVLIDLGLHSKVGNPALGKTEAFAAPEVMRSLGNATHKSDVFGVAATLEQGIERVSRLGTHDLKPSDGLRINTDEAAFTQDRNGRPQHIPGVAGAHTAYTGFMGKLLDPDPSKRPDSDEAKAMDFLSDSLLGDDAAKEVLKKVLDPKLNPKLLDDSSMADVMDSVEDLDDIELSSEKLRQTKRDVVKLKAQKASIQEYDPAVCIVDLEQPEELVDRAFQSGRMTSEAAEVKQKIIETLDRVAENARLLARYQRGGLPALNPSEIPKNIYLKLRLPIPVKMNGIYKASARFAADARAFLAEHPRYADRAKLDLMVHRAKALIDLQQLGPDQHPMRNSKELARLHEQLSARLADIENTRPASRQQKQQLEQAMKPWIDKANKALSTFQPTVRSGLGFDGKRPVISDEAQIAAGKHANVVAEDARKVLDETRDIRGDMQAFADQAQAFLAGPGRRGYPEAELRALREALKTARTLLNLEREWITPAKQAGVRRSFRGFGKTPNLPPTPSRVAEDHLRSRAPKPFGAALKTLEQAIPKEDLVLAKAYLISSAEAAMDSVEDTGKYFPRLADSIVNEYRVATKTNHLAQLRGLWRQGADEALGRIADRFVKTKPSTTAVKTPSQAPTVNRKTGLLRGGPTQAKTVKQNKNRTSRVAFSDLNTLLGSASGVDATAITKPGPVPPGVAFFQDPQVGSRCGEHALKNYVGGDFLSNEQLTDFAAATWLHGHPGAKDVERRTVDASQGNDAAVLREYLNWQISAQRLSGLDPVETVVVHGQDAAARFRPSGDRCIIQTQQPNHFFAFRRDNSGQWRRVDSRDAKLAGLSNQQPKETPTEFLQRKALAHPEQRIQVIQPAHGAAASRALAHAMLLDEARDLDDESLALLRQRLDVSITTPVKRHELRKLVREVIQNIRKLKQNPVAFHQAFYDLGLVTTAHVARSHFVDDLLQQQAPNMDPKQRNKLIDKSLGEFEKDNGFGLKLNLAKESDALTRFANSLLDH